ncbi:MAG TPA: sulfite exporter TauE/SafE family protein [Paralcaligenes sp.]|jgi:Sulfite exporter TauE/SafE.
MTLQFFGGLFPSLTVFVMLCAATACAGAFRSFAGFGGGLMLAPLYGLFMPPTDVLVVLLLLNLVTTVQMLPQVLKSVQWKLVISLAVPSLFGIPLGLLALHFIDPMSMRKLIAAIVTVMSAILLTGWCYKGRRGHLQNGIAGLTSGSLTAIGAIGGPPVILYLLSSKDYGPTVLRSVFIAYFGIAIVATLTPLLFMGSITMAQAAHAASLLPVYLLATAVGTIAHQRMAGSDDGSIRRISLLVLLAIGVVTFFV